jgi:hypothetical protein
MPISIHDVEHVQLYFAGVMGRSAHHAETVGAVALTLLGAVLWRKDKDAPLEVRRNEGAMGNVAWFEVGGNRYALTYNHGKEAIDLHERTQSGKVIESFTNKTPSARVLEVFGGL